MKQKNELAVQVGELIRQKREKQRLSIRQWAKQTGKTRQWISAIERGEGSPTIDTLKFIADSLNLKIKIDFKRPKKKNPKALG